MKDDVEILTLPAARPEFTNLSEDFVWKAIREDPEQGTPISGEVTRLMVECMGTFKALFGEDGYLPPRVLRIEARCPIEKVAVLMVMRFVEAETGAACPVTFH